MTIHAWDTLFNIIIVAKKEALLARASEKLFFWRGFQKAQKLYRSDGNQD